MLLTGMASSGATFSMAGLYNERVQSHTTAGGDEVDRRDDLQVG